MRDAFLRHDYTVTGVPAALGTTAHAALARGETVPARRRTAGGGPLATLVRLFLLQLDVPERHAAHALPLEDAVALGLVARDGDRVRAALDVRPYAGDDSDAPWWVVADLGTGLDGRTAPLGEDHVLGVGGASTTLAQLVPRGPVGTALDVGTGCGVQALHLATHARAVTGTDVLPRALELARLTAAFSDVPLDLRAGSLYAPVAGERFDLVVSNPPFVVSPAGRYAYRDSGLPGDEVCRRLVAGAPDVLAPGGTLVMLANWVSRAGEPWQERVAGWLPPVVQAWVVQRDVQDPAAYVATWLRDSGETGSAHYVEAYDAWLSALEADGVEGIGFGWVVLRRTDGNGAVRLEEWPHAVEQPLGPYVDEELASAAWSAATDDAVLVASRLVLAPDVVQEQHGEPGAEDPEVVVLRRGRGMRRAERCSTELAATAGACDGSLPLGGVLDAVAMVLGQDPADVRRNTVPQVRRLVEQGFLRPA